MFDNVLDAVSGAIPAPICTLEVARTHAACIEAVHRVAPIVDVPAEYVSVGEGGQRVIAGIEGAARQAWESVMRRASPHGDTEPEPVIPSSHEHIPAPRPRQSDDNQVRLQVMA